LIVRIARAGSGVLRRRRLGHPNDRYLRQYTNPPEDIAVSWAEHL
jgi:hypothetical protein